MPFSRLHAKRAPIQEGAQDRKRKEEKEESRETEVNRDFVEDEDRKSITHLIDQVRIRHYSN